MDAEKVVKELGRMCSSMGNCADCKVSQLRDEEPHFCMHYVYKYPAETVRIVEEWSKAHPIQTNREKLKEVFGFYFNRNRYGSGCVRSDCIGGDCENCQYGDDWWWDMPYEAPKGGSTDVGQGE